MRVAAIGDAWKRLRRGDRLLEFLEMSWRDVPRLSDGALRLTNPITLVCGENGAGKSSILHLLYQALGGQDSGDYGNYCRSKRGVVDVVRASLRPDLKEKFSIVEGDDLVTHLGSGSDGELLAMFDPGMHVPATISYIRAEGSFSDLLEGVSPREFTKLEIEHVSFVVGRYYEKVEVYEILDSSFGSLLPYFVAEYQGARYGSDDMGYGELSALMFVWLMSRIPSGAILLIEEPEAFLAPRAQIALVDFLAESSGKNNVTIMMTSHSGAIATRLRLEEISYVMRSKGEVLLHSPPRLNDLIERLGLVAGRVPLLFVEDAVAAIFSKVLIDRFSSRLSGRGEYVVMNGDGGVRAIVDKVPASVFSVAHIGVMDGDQRSTLSPQKKNLLCLPGEKAPENILIDYAMAMKDADLSVIMGCSLADLARAVAHAAGSNHHEWIGELAAGLQIGREDVVRRLAIAWASDNDGAALAFVQQVEEIVFPGF